MNEDAQPHPLPPHVRWLGVLLKAQADRIAEAFAADARGIARSTRPPLRLDRIGDMLQSRLDFAHQLEATLARIHARVLAPASVDDAAVFQAVQPLRELLWPQLSQLDDLQRADRGDDDSSVRRWLIEQQQQLLEDVRIGLANVARAIEDPVAELERRQQATSGDVTLSLALQLRPLRHQKALSDWVARQEQQRASDALHSSPSDHGRCGPGLLGLLLLWIGLDR